MTGIVLIGFMGAGKTTIGETLSQLTGRQLLDLDTLIVEETGMSIQAYFDKHGEAGFRQKETETLQLNACKQNSIISTGGGIVLKPENREILKQLQNVVYLQATADELIIRLEEDPVNVRPLTLSKTPDEIKAIYEPRIPFYQESATFIVETTGRTPHHIAQEIIERVGQ